MTRPPADITFHFVFLRPKGVLFDYDKKSCSGPAEEELEEYRVGYVGLNGGGGAVGRAGVLENVTRRVSCSGSVS